MVLPLLILLAVLLFLFLPRNVTVPEVTGSKSTFDAEQKLVEADLKLAPAPKEKVSTEAPPGTVIGQTPEAGEKAKKDSEVALLIAIGNGKVQVPSVVGQTQAEAEKTLREKKLTIGQLQPQPPDPKAKISSQIPAADEVVTEGKPIDLFMATIKDKKKKKGGDDEKERRWRRRRRQSRGGHARPRWPACPSPRRRRRPPTPASSPRRSPSSPARRRAS